MVMDFRLETVTKACLYVINEVQSVTELDSPAPGAEHVVARRASQLLFYSSRALAAEKIIALQKDYMERNSTLEKKSSSSGYLLVGSVPHAFAHEYRIGHNIDCCEVSMEKVNDKTKALLHNPQRTIQTEFVDEFHYQSFSSIDNERMRGIIDTLRTSLL
ncbi:MAG: hypothetical protein RL557_1023 [archaeon]|jgi:hypothetical protein